MLSLYKKTTFAKSFSPSVASYIVLLIVFDDVKLMRMRM